jgi:hypothetical protein
MIVDEMFERASLLAMTRPPATPPNKLELAAGVWANGVLAYEDIITDFSNGSGVSRQRVDNLYGRLGKALELEGRRFPDWGHLDGSASQLNGLIGAALFARNRDIDLYPMPRFDVPDSGGSRFSMYGIVSDRPWQVDISMRNVDNRDCGILIEGEVIRISLYRLIRDKLHHYAESDDSPLEVGVGQTRRRMVQAIVEESRRQRPAEDMVRLLDWLSSCLATKILNLIPQPNE